MLAVVQSFFVWREKEVLLWSRKSTHYDPFHHEGSLAYQQSCQGILIWHLGTCQQSGKKIFLLMHGCALRMQGKLYLSLGFSRSTPPSQSLQKFSRNMECTTPVKSLG